MLRFLKIKIEPKEQALFIFKFIAIEVKIRYSGIGKEKKKCDNGKMVCIEYII